MKEYNDIGPEDDSVHLPVVFGVKPRSYLAVFYAVILIIILFFLLIYPGMISSGSIFTVSSEPYGAAVRIDGVYYACTPADVFVSKGKHQITVGLTGFEPFETEITAEGRVFGSFFFPKRAYLAVHLTEKEPLAALKAGAQDYAVWTFAGEPTVDYQIPLSLSEGVYRSVPKTAQTARPLLEAAARFMVTQAALKDLLRAEFLNESGGGAPSPVTALGAVRAILSYMEKNPSFTVALTDILPDEAAGKLAKSAVYPAVWTENPARAAAQTGSPLTVDGIRFSAEFVPAVYSQNSGFQHEATVGPFYLSKNAVSLSEWRRFLAENPAWRRENAEALIKEGLITEDYLAPFDSEGLDDGFFAAYPDYPAPAVSCISWFAAQAFCLWLNTKLPPDLAGKFEARLPSEAEWEYAVENAALWEWCGDFYAPLDFLAADAGAITVISSPERSVRGKSWVKTANSVLPEMRASLPPETCSVFGGFRVVIALKKTPNQTGD
ncbi:MAG: SUMF1/EgtB/PvdO family nonheme iron enzyme [Spirochaetaceae bacterium]|jgi:formylglycine-generating enzyme required for sulfatase activity|nr:SUMF1/EgtB/PvdO family nonheme iron enzyme [Spirochaetaceae bacterium]